jgi:predicted nucleic acid-binding protein
VTRCVVDASVAAKWLLPAAGETLVDQANHLLSLHLRGDLRLLAPDLICAEVGNVLWKAARSKRISTANAENSLQRFSDIRVDLAPAVSLFVPALQIATSCDRTFYDSLYVALALTTRSEFITADERLVNALGTRFPVRWLGAF